MSTKSTRARATLPLNVVIPITLGLAAFVLLYTLINHQVIDNEMVRRYLAGHAVSKVTTALFLIALSSLLLICRDVLRQYRWLGRVTLQPPQPAESSTDAAATATPSNGQLRTHLSQLDQRLHQGYLWRRIMTALKFIDRNGCADGLDEELKYAAELDVEEKHDRYAFARIMIWAIPMLGFLGTVLGISEALGGIDVGEDNNFQEMMGGLRTSLYVAFDTTAIALTFAIILMFTMFGIDRIETGLLAHVDARAREELSHHWVINNQLKDSYVQTVEAIGSQLLESVEGLVDRQIKLWRKNIKAAETAWVESVKSAQEVVGGNLRDALNESTGNLQSSVTTSIQRSDEAVSRRWEQWQVTLSENARLLCGHQEQLVEHAKQMNKLVNHVGDISETKQVLADYIKSLPDTSDFANATEQLSTAIRILEFRLTDLNRQHPQTAGRTLATPSERAA